MRAAAVWAGLAAITALSWGIVWMTGTLVARQLVH